MSGRWTAPALWGAIAVLALGADRPRFGGTLRVATPSPAATGDPLLQDTPGEAALAPLGAQAACRTLADGRIEWTGFEVASSHPLRWSLTPRPTARWTDGQRVTAAELAQVYARIASAELPSPYRALLHPLRGPRRAPAVRGGAVELVLGHPWPDLERSLCHPALALWNKQAALAPFIRDAEGQAAFPGFPRGRPFVDRLHVILADERRGTRLLELGQADLLVGGDAAALGVSSGTALFATYLVFNPRRAPAGLRAHVEAGVDRRDLVRFFVPAPAVPMSRLLPPALLPQQAEAPPAAPAPQAPFELTLLYDEALGDHRAVAERLQVRLHGMGFRIAPTPLGRAALRSRWAASDFDVLLFSVLLPPAAGPALAIALDLAGRRDLLGTELQAIGAIPDAGARDALARSRAEALLPTLPLVPLYARGIRVVAPRLGPLTYDGFGIPQLEDVSLPRVAR